MIERPDLGDETPQKQCVDTNPYCPPEAAMSSDDTPPVIEGDNKLPARDNQYVMRVKCPAGHTYK